MGQENLMSVRPFVRADNNYFLRTESGGVVRMLLDLGGLDYGFQRVAKEPFTYLD